MKIKIKQITQSRQQKEGVGYKRPPVWTRYKKGQSGNPKGRPKKDETFRAIAERELQKQIMIKEGGRVRRVTLKVAIVKRCLAEAASGKIRNLEFITKLLNQTAPVHVQEELTAQEQELWKTYFKDSNQ